MRRTRPAHTRATLLAAAACLPLAHAAWAQSAPSHGVALQGAVSPFVAQAVRTGAAPNDRVVTLSVYLSMRDEAGLRALVAAQQTPGAPEYRHYLSPAQFRARFAPDEAAVAAVKAELARMGFTIVHSPASGFYIEVNGTVGLVKSAFGVSQDLYAYKGRTLRANREAPTLSPTLAAHVSYIAGLDDGATLRHPAHLMLGSPRSPTLVTEAAAHRAAPPPEAAENPSPYCDHYFGDLVAKVSPAPAPYAGQMPWLGCDYNPQQMQQAYGVDKVKLDGKGVRVAAVDAFASPTMKYDLSTYSQNHGLPKITKDNFTQIIPKGIYKVPADNPCGPQGWYGEESLDLESIHSIAPGASLVYVGSKDCGTSLDNALYDAIDNHSADVISNSWSFNGEGVSMGAMNTGNAAFMQAATEGISVMFSSGDDGDLSQVNGVASGAWPATSPYVTAVGGTSLLLADKSGTKTEYGWGTYRAYLTTPVIKKKGTLVTNTGVGDFAFYSGAGGGPSQYQDEPDYQKGVVPKQLADRTHKADGTVVKFDSPKRVTPDIGMDADPYTGFLFGETFTISATAVANTGCTAINDKVEYCEGGIGGTSLASPMFAGVLALVNQARTSNNLPAIGFANPTLYTLKTGTPGAKAAPITDILAPDSPQSVLRGYVATPDQLRLVTINSAPGCGSVCEGLDDVFNNVTPGYDNVTGVGVPYVPALITAIGSK